MSDVTPIGILVNDIDTRIQNLSYCGREEYKKFEPTKLLTGKALTQYKKLEAADAEYRKAAAVMNREREKLKKLLGPAETFGYYLETEYIKGANDQWKKFMFRETDKTAHNRVNGKASERQKKRESLKTLREEALLAAAGNKDLTPFFERFMELKK
jgi:hypothetical protein